MNQSSLVRSPRVSPALRLTSGSLKPRPGVVARNVSQSLRRTISRPHPVECVVMSPRAIAVERVDRGTPSCSAARGTVQQSETNGITIFAAFFFAMSLNFQKWISGSTYLRGPARRRGVPAPGLSASAPPHSVSEFFELVGQLRDRCIVGIGCLVLSAVRSEGRDVSGFELACQCVPDSSADFQAQFVQAHGLLLRLVGVFVTRLHTITHKQTECYRLSFRIPSFCPE